MEHTFEALGLRAALVTALAEQGITTPTEIQQKMIPEILSGKDVIGRSETGSGKTLAYLLPIFEKLDRQTAGKAESKAAYRGRLCRAYSGFDS